MNIHHVFQLINTPDTLQRIATVLQHHQTALIQLAVAGRIADTTDRDNILRYFRDKQLPTRPTTIEEVMKNFASSALSYSVVRRSLGTHIGAIPTASSIAKALAAEFSDARFLDDAYWKPSAMKTLALDVAGKRGLTNAMLGEKTLHSRILGVLHDGAQQIAIASKNGLDAYYAAIEQQVSSPEKAWQMLEQFTKNKIRQVGPTLAMDFMKNIGFHMFVKPDVHFLQQLPTLTGLGTKFSPRDSFILGWWLASALKTPAFVLDHTLYQWGRHGGRSAC
ncbi:MAG: hypothetical protein J5X22_23405 [Candidatus Accumulibacter sp.]|uniref:hypothetical protein n=1 Tax=Accumulibacter sp. TaxID=2053492 RepID=UPI001ACEA159|nr:hypothetical protein [Accumulibacter sp.]MBN8519278.1 hypothetical protein [Accumulibacter sp.]MBO3713308.1 hypothetical protein [Accumulibacter sp.]HMV59260.1 hypothetical protein [Nitrospira sp.]HRE19019.1 hypothetical protein [Rhodocyclaceae bacterium]